MSGAVKGRVYRAPDPLDLTGRMSEWMRAVTAPTPYRVSASLSLNTYRLAQLAVTMLLLLTGLVLLIPLLLGGPRTPPPRYLHIPPYNTTYPLSPPTRHPDGSVTYRVGAVADMDTDSKSRVKKNVWVSYLKRGYLTISADHKSVHVEWDPTEAELESGLSLGGRGMELSELTVFNGRLYTCDDRTGAVFEITPALQLLPFVVLGDGDGLQTKGFKCEWMAVRDSVLWVGGLGKEWTTTGGQLVNLHPQWVKSVGPLGDVQHHDWVEHFNALRVLAGCPYPGYLIHESASWSEVHGRWFFLPRRASTETYTETEDERRATNLLLTADPAFSSLRLSRVGSLSLTRGFSAFRFVPGTNDGVILAIKSEEDSGRIASYVTAFSVGGGEVLMEESKMGEHKYEGIEFI